MALNDSKFWFLRNLGFSGALPDMEKAYYKNPPAPGGTPTPSTTNAIMIDGNMLMMDGFPILMT